MARAAILMVLLASQEAKNPSFGVAARRISNSQKQVYDVNLDDKLGMDGEFHQSSKNTGDAEPVEKKEEEDKIAPQEPVPMDEQDKHVAAMEQEQAAEREAQQKKIDEKIKREELAAKKKAEAKLYHQKEVNEELPNAQQPSASVLVETPLPDQPKPKKADEPVENDEDPLDMQVDFTEQQTKSRFTEDDFEMKPEVPEITDEDEMIMLDNDIPPPDDEIENDAFLQLETDLDINPLGDGYVEEEDDFFLQDDEVAFAQLDQAMADEDNYLLLEEQVNLTDDEEDHSDEWFLAEEIGMAPLGVEYSRNVPEQYNEESPNKFMYLILTNFALEGKNTDGTPNGVFKMDQKETKRAGKMIVEKYKHKEGQDNDDYMKQYFDRTWEHFDVNNDGKLDALDMPAFMKFLCSDQSIDLDS